MAFKIFEDTRLTPIADAIRSKDRTTDPIRVGDMADRIENIPDYHSRLQQWIDRSIEEITEDDMAGITELRGYTFHHCEKLKKCALPEGITIFSAGEFYACRALLKIKIPDTITSMGNECFRVCSSLQELIIPDSVTTAGHHTVANCTSLTSLRISENLTTIREYFALDCTALPTVVIPAKIESIGAYAFNDCVRLTTIECRATTPPTLADATSLPGTSIVKYIYVPAASVDAYKAAPYWSDYADRIYGTKLGHAIERSLTALTADDFAGATGIRYGCARANKLTSLEFSNTITGIGAYSFANNYYLKKIIIPDSVTELGTYPGTVEPNAGFCFAYCTALEKVVIGTGMQTIGNNMFDGDTALTTIVCKATTPPTIALSSLSGPANLAHIYVPSDSVAAYKAADNWSEYASIIEAITDDVNEDTVGRPGTAWDSKITAYFKKTLTAVYANEFTGDTIGYASFALMSNLKTVIMPDTITNMSEEVFMRSGIEEVHWPTGRALVTNNSFNACTSLKNIVFPSTVTAFGNTCFADCTSLTTFECRATTPPTFGTNMFKNCTNLKYIYVPADSVTAYKTASGWSDYADIIYGSKMGHVIGNKITNLTADDCAGVDKLGTMLFSWNDDLKTVELSNTITTIGSFTFQGASILSIILPDSVLVLGTETTNAGSCFASCRSLTKVVIGTGLQNTGTNAFHNCTALNTIICKATTPPNLNNAGSLEGCASLTHIYVPAGSVDAYKAANIWSTYATIIEAITDDIDVDTTGRPGTMWDERLLTYFNHGLTYINEDEFYNTTTVSQASFYYQSQLVDVSLPSTITSLAYFAFSKCSALPYIVIPSSVTNISTHAFFNCTSLTTVECRAMTPPTLASDAFYGCTALAHIYVPSASVDTYKSASGWSNYASIISAIP